MKGKSSSNAFFWLGLIILIGLLIFKWIPDWTWRPDLPEININNYIFESRPNWQGETAIIESTINPTIHIRITPKKAVDKRANLRVTVDGREVSDNCGGSEKNFCYKIPSSDNYNGAEHSVVAKNDAGEAHAAIKVVVKPKTTNESSDSVPSNDQSQPTDSAPSTPPTPSPSPTAQDSTPTHSSACSHTVDGVCLDDLEDEAYSAGLYDHEYGRYGTSFEYGDNCNATCREYLEDAYDEGWYDYH